MACGERKNDDESKGKELHRGCKEGTWDAMDSRPKPCPFHLCPTRRHLAALHPRTQTPPLRRRLTAEYAPLSYLVVCVTLCAEHRAVMTQQGQKRSAARRAKEGGGGGRRRAVGSPPLACLGTWQARVEWAGNELRHFQCVSGRTIDQFEAVRSKLHTTIPAWAAASAHALLPCLARAPTISSPPQ